MSLVQQSDQDPVHVPKRRDVFQFDSEVAAIFPNMAVRSIPMYREVHRLHAAILKRMYVGRPLSILDVGASRGHFLREVCNQLQNSHEERWLHCTAMEQSEPMLAHIRADLPHVECLWGDITQHPEMPQRYDAISMFYVLQFVPDKEKRAALEWAYSWLKPGGVLLLGQKEDQARTGNQAILHDEYIQFRVDNGYDKAEIEAKTAALKNSMWCVDRDDLHTVLQDIGFYNVHDTSRWLMFSTLMARR